LKEKFKNLGSRRKISDEVIIPPPQKILSENAEEERSGEIENFIHQFKLDEPEDQNMPPEKPLEEFKRKLENSEPVKSEFRVDDALTKEEKMPKPEVFESNDDNQSDSKQKLFNEAFERMMFEAN